MDKISPSICLGALDAINFLIETYGPSIENEYNLKQLHKAKVSFEENYNSTKHFQEIDELAVKNRNYSKKTTMAAYGKLYVSKDIEKDPLYVAELEKEYKLSENNGSNFSNIEYLVGYALGLRSSRHLIDKISKQIKNSETLLDLYRVIKDIDDFYNQIILKIDDKNLTSDEIRNMANTDNGLLGMLDAYTFCNDNYGVLISDNFDFGVKKVTEKINHSYTV